MLQVRLLRRLLGAKGRGDLGSEKGTESRSSRLRTIKEVTSDEKKRIYLRIRDQWSPCKWIDHYDTGFPWALIVTGDDEYAESMGIYTDYIGHITPFDQEKYPYLLRFKDPFMEDPYDEPPYIEEYAKKHFISMLQYQKDNPEFLKMVEGQTIGIDGEPIKEWTKAKIDYIEKNGLKVYGFAVDATKEMLQNIAKSGKVCSIQIQENS